MLNDKRSSVRAWRGFSMAIVVSLFAGSACDSGGVDPDDKSVLPVTTNRLNVGESTTCALSSTNHLFCWGLNSGFAEFGVSSARQPSSSVPVATDTAVFVGLATGHGSHACGIASDGNSKCWGRNNLGQLGSNSALTGDSTPRRLLTTTFSAISIGRITTCGISRLSLAYCWGANQRGEGGNSTRGIGESASAPRVIEGNREFIAIAAGWTFSCGIIKSGEAYCWGDNALGQLGIGVADTAARRLPLPVQTTLRFKQITAGGNYACAITTDNSAYCWGQNATGNLGDGTTTTRVVPTAVGGNLKFTKISASSGFGTGSLAGLPNAPVGAVAHTCALTEAGTAYCWGWNGFGQLGDGTLTDRVSPVAVSGGQTFNEIGAGGFHTCGMRANLVACWGGNTSGQLGNNSLNNSSVPVTAGLPFAN